MSKRRLGREAYRVGWICPLQVELTAALQMLDEEHERLPQSCIDTNTYHLGSINGHNVVIAGLPVPGNCPAATVITQMQVTYPSLKCYLLVGIGGGVPRKTDSGMIRLGHVVVGTPTGKYPGTIQNDHGKARAGRFEQTGFLAVPPAVPLNATRDLDIQRQLADEDPIQADLKKIDTSRPSLRRFQFPGAFNDHLFPMDYAHQTDGLSCVEGGCDLNRQIHRVNSDCEEDSCVVVHTGTIASGEMVIKDAQKRELLAQEHNILCFEMEVAGALSHFPCLVIRGISDYCDSHKNDMWHGYAAAVAAAYARQIFSHLPIEESLPAPPVKPKLKPSPTLINPFPQAVKDGKIEDIESWLQVVDVDARDSRTGRTALSFAAQAGNILVAKILLKNRASVNIRQYTRPGEDQFGGPHWTGGGNELGWAVDRGHTEMAELLLENGANPNSRNTMGHTALHYACMLDNHRIARVLLQKGANVDCSHNGWTPLHEAIFRDSLETLRIVLEYQPSLDVNTRTNDKTTPLHMAVIKKRADIVNLLLRHGASVDVRMKEDNTPLHMAAAGGWIEGIRILVEANAPLNAKDELLLETPLHKAARNREATACLVLINYGSDPKERNVDDQDYGNLLELAEQYPDDWKVDPSIVNFLA